MVHNYYPSLSLCVSPSPQLSKLKIRYPLLFAFQRDLCLFYSHSLATTSFFPLSLPNLHEDPDWRQISQFLLLWLLQPIRIVSSATCWIWIEISVISIFKYNIATPSCCRFRPISNPTWSSFLLHGHNIHTCKSHEGPHTGFYVIHLSHKSSSWPID